MDNKQIDEFTDRLSVLLNTIINRKQPNIDFRVGHHVGIYLNLFMETVNQNNGAPLPFDRFNASLFLKVATDRDDHAKETMKDFHRTWTAWEDLFRHLNPK